MDNEKEKTYIASNLKYLRSINGKSLNDVASICDKSDVAIHYWENGTREPNAVDIAKLSNYYNVSVDELLLKDLRFDNKSIEHQTLDEFIQECNDDLMSQYRVLFDKDNALTQEQKSFMINFLEDQHKKIDNNERIDD